MKQHGLPTLEKEVGDLPNPLSFGTAGWDERFLMGWRRRIQVQSQ
jgi:hypothetical protein